jgi:hypothetical protein
MHSLTYYAAGPHWRSPDSTKIPSPSHEWTSYNLKLMIVSALCLLTSTLSRDAFPLQRLACSRHVPDLFHPPLPPHTHTRR